MEMPSGRLVRDSLLVTVGVGEEDGGVAVGDGERAGGRGLEVEEGEW